jgi:hypothetical protein
MAALVARRNLPASSAASALIAPRLTSWGTDGNAQALPSGIDPNPHAS